MWTIERITERCIDYCGRCGVEFNSPVGINGRLTRTLGRCIYKKIDFVWQPTRIEISRKLLETSPDNCIEEVIAHLMKDLPDTIPPRSMVQIRIENKDKGQKQDYTRMVR